jgi:DNA-binding transcriptional LysR family regulator
VELRHLAYFVAVAEERQFSRAAKRMGISQPPLSQQIRHLESELQVKLLARTTRQVQLTDAGRVFLEHARKTLDAANGAVHAARQAARGDIGELRLGYVASAVYEALPTVLKAYKRGHTRIEIAVSQLTTSEQVEQLQSEQIDVGLLRPPVYSDELQLYVFRREPMFVILPSNHPLTQKPQIDIDDLAGERLIVWPRSTSPGGYDRVLGMCRQAGWTPNVMEAQGQGLISLVAADMGVGLVSGFAHAWPARDVELRPLRGAKLLSEMAVGWRRGQQSRLVADFVHVVRTECSTPAPLPEAGSSSS